VGMLAKNIEGFPTYVVNTYGDVWSLKKGCVIRNYQYPIGYVMVSLYYDGASALRIAHRLVAKAFIPNPEGKRTVNHIDGNKVNNQVDNLEWNTQKENNTHAWRTGLQPNTRNGKAVQQYSGSTCVSTFRSVREATRSTGVHHSGISKVCNGHHKTAGGYVWKYVEEGVKDVS